MGTKTNNYLRNRRGAIHFFDDRDPEEVRDANKRVTEMRSDFKGDHVVAWKAAPGLHPDGYVGVWSGIAKLAEVPKPPSLLS